MKAQGFQESRGTRLGDFLEKPLKLSSAVSFSVGFQVEHA